ncbi:helix-turn-helix domain-containing protein [Actinomadura rupiterrae]|uniref:helix-turn-helix domain-containing protein n=1 Tax=Actinomadura rupiterrae TaxID=559627 RepID=UPI0020A5AAFE|nr:helix-turn-helix domain-containing protein [Actinomadura rupiterrae]MCP2339435.1 DNA-binding transcriptional ArsR family regulator [Actinomadura rupiterrae]
MRTLELFAHPVRLRIVHALRGGRVLPTSRLAELVPDVSKATVYRHVEALAAGGVLEVADERRVRGAVERRYRLSRERADVDPAEAAALSPDEHRAAFTAALAALAAEFDAYLDRDGSDPASDPVGYRQHALWLSPDELAALLADLRAAIVPHLKHQAGPGRDRYLLSPILFPSETAPADEFADGPGPDGPAVPE